MPQLGLIANPNSTHYLQTGNNWNKMHLAVSTHASPRSRWFAVERSPGTRDISRLIIYDPGETNCQGGESAVLFAEIRQLLCYFIIQIFARTGLLSDEFVMRSLLDGNSTCVVHLRSLVYHKCKSAGVITTFTATFQYKVMKRFTATKQLVQINMTSPVF